MNKSKTRRQAAPLLIITAVILALSFGPTAAGNAAQAQEPFRYVAGESAYGSLQSIWSASFEGTQVPQDIRIMQRIVRTALGEVEAPELPEGLADDAQASGSGGNFLYSVDGSASATLWLSGAGNRAYAIGSRDVTGFYMQGYGYLFTVKWRVAPTGSPLLYSRLLVDRAYELRSLAREARSAATTTEPTEARAAADAEKALEEESERLEAQQAAWDQWSSQYRDKLAAALHDVVALYGSTLKRATPDESITFMADFGGEEAEKITLSARRGDLAGASREENLAAVRLAKGETGVSGTLRTELKIMAEIIGSSLQIESTGDMWIVRSGGDSSYQYVPGYGVLFHTSARLNLATQVIRQLNPARFESGVTVQSLRQQIDESTEEQRHAYTEHLAELKEKTAEILATYGPTLTEMAETAWVGVFYDVGSAAGLLEGGITNFLVQARMGDIRNAGGQSEGAAWLLDRLVTNEKQD